MCVLVRKSRKKKQSPIISFKQRLTDWLTLPWRRFQTFCYYIGLSVVVIAGFFAAYLIFFFRSLPDLESSSFESLKKRAQSQIEAKLEKSKQKLKWTPLKKIHRDLLYTVVFSEDSQFFEHDGVDFDAILASAALNLKAGKYAYGASTISQQVVKNLFLDHEKTLTRKLKEILITQDLERSLTKNQILELYLNMAEFGPDLYGVQAAATYYFDKSPAQINAAEGAFMALMLPSPRKNHYAIFQNQNLTRSKRKKLRRILRDMMHQEFISASQYRNYRKYPYFKKTRRRGLANH